MNRIENWIRPNILALKPYQSARDEFQGEADCYLDANENPYAWSYNRYPDSKHLALRQEIALWRGTKKEQILLGNGSDEIIDLLIRACCEPGRDSIRVLDPSYGMYAVTAGINNIDIIRTELNEDFGLDPSIMETAWLEEEKLFFLCSPNNPSGNSLDRMLLKKLIKSYPGIVVVDEAYIDFATQESVVPWIQNFENLVVMQTFSKSMAAAGIRVGMAFAQKEMIGILGNVKPPYNLSSMAINEAQRMIKNWPVLQDQIQELKATRESFTNVVEKLSFVKKVFPSDANFLLIEVNDANYLYQLLLKKGIVVRNRSAQKGCFNCLRFSIGTPSEMNNIIQVLNEFENE